MAIITKGSPQIGDSAPIGPANLRQMLGKYGIGRDNFIDLERFLEQVKTSINGSDGSGPAPASAEFLTLATNTALTAERVFTPSPRFSATDGGANGPYALDLATTGATGTYTYPSSLTVDDWGRVTAAASGVAPVSGSGTATRIAFWATASTLSSSANLYWDNTNSRLSLGAGSSPTCNLHSSITDAATNSTTLLRQYDHGSSGTTAAGFGVHELFRLHNASGTMTDAAKVSAKWLNATAGSEAGKIVHAVGVNGGGLKDVVAYSANGNTVQVEMGQQSTGLAGVNAYLYSDTRQSGLTMSETDGNLLAFVNNSRTASGNTIGFYSLTGETWMSSNQAATTWTQRAQDSTTSTWQTWTPAAHTNVTASTEETDLDFALNRTVTWATGTLTTQRFIRVQAPTIAFNSNSTCTNPFTMQIEAVKKGSHATFTYGEGNSSGVGHALGLIMNVASVDDGTAPDLLRLERVNSSTVGDEGTSIAWFCSNASHSVKQQASLQVKWNNPAAGSESATGALILTDGGTELGAYGWIASPTAFTVPKRLYLAQGASVASANTMTLGSDGNYFVITGNTTINGITTTGWTAGSFIILEFSSTPTVTNNSGAPGAGAVAIQCAGGANLTIAAHDTIGLFYNGNYWMQVSPQLTHTTS